MSVKLGEVAEEVFGEVKTIEISDEEWEEICRRWEDVEESEFLAIAVEEFASEEELGKHCTF